MMQSFVNPQASHEHSRQILESLREFDDFMGSLRHIVDMGCGNEGLDLEWWATASTREKNPRPLNIQCTGIDLAETVKSVKRHKNIVYQQQDFEDPIVAHKKKFDVIWCHNSFQYVINPLQTLENWRAVANRDAMLLMAVQQTTNFSYKTTKIEQTDGCYHHWTVVNLMHALAVTGWDCRDGYFKKSADDPWIYVAVYNTGNKPRDPKTTRWYDLADAKVLPDSAVASVKRWGYLRQEDLVLQWLDKSINMVG